MKRFRLAFCLASMTCASAAFAQAEETFQFTVAPGTAANGQDVLRTATATGESILCAETTTCIAIAEPAPPGPGNYRLASWSTLDMTQARRVWNAIRYDLASGRIWGLNYDGTTASWLEYTYPAP